MTRFPALILLLTGLLFSSPLLAEVPSRVPAKLSAADQAEVARAEQYLNGLRTLKARFQQNSDNGNQLGGTFYLSRPGKMRLEYDPPVKDYVVSDGWFVFFWDGELEQQSSTPVGSSLADVFLRDTVKLSGDVTITGFSRQGGVVEITIIETDDPGKGDLTLIFDERPYQLRKWRVVDAQGAVTHVALSQVQTGLRLENSLFLFRDPKFNRRSN